MADNSWLLAGTDGQPLRADNLTDDTRAAMQVSRDQGYLEFPTALAAAEFAERLAAYERGQRDEWDRDHRASRDAYERRCAKDATLMPWIGYTLYFQRLRPVQYTTA